MEKVFLHMLLQHVVNQFLGILLILLNVSFYNVSKILSSKNRHLYNNLQTLLSLLLYYSTMNKPNLAMEITKEKDRQSQEKIIVTPSESTLLLDIGKGLNKTDTAKVMLLACTGNLIVQTAKSYPTGFFIQYLEDNSLNHSFGTISISAIMVTSALAFYLTPILPVRYRKTSLLSRCLLYCLVNCVCCALVALLDPALEFDASGNTSLGILLVIRTLQGLPVGLLFVLAQGELIDIHFKGDKLLVVLIGAAQALGEIRKSSRLYLARNCIRQEGGSLLD